MPSSLPKLNCTKCGKAYASSAIKRHLSSCHSPQEDREEPYDSLALFKVFALYDRTYSLYLAVKTDTTLADLDAYLRQIWLECCGHMSAFRIGSESYVSSPDPGWGDHDLDIDCIDAMEGIDRIIYEYDFGSTTPLALQIVGILPDLGQKSKIELLARNLAPSFSCETCDKEATWICSFCQSFHCEDCIQDDACPSCQEEGLLPVVNSPRMGVCGYDGESFF